MSILFKDRGILDTFSNRNIVWKYECADSGRAGIFLNFYFDFGLAGSVFFKRTFFLKEKREEFNNDVRQFLGVVHQFRNSLVRLNTWIFESGTPQFHETVVDVYPTVVFGSRRGNDIQVILMGFETNRLMIKFTRNERRDGDRIMMEKINSMVKVVDQFLMTCDTELGLLNPQSVSAKVVALA